MAQVGDSDYRPPCHGDTMPPLLPSPQLDLFFDARDVALINATADAICKHDLSEALECFGQLAHEFPDTTSIPHFAELLAVLDDRPDVAARAEDIEALINKLQRTAQHAHAALGPRAESFMKPLWRQLAELAEGCAFQADKPHLHSAALYLRAADFCRTIEAADKIPNWHRHTQVLQWLTLATYRAEGDAAARPFLFGLAWREPQELAVFIRDLGANMFLSEWQRFENSHFAEDYTEDDLAHWFPAWSLIEQPALRTRFDRYEMGIWNYPGAAAFRLILGLLAQETQGHSRELVDARGRLRSQYPALFESYMAKRKTQYL